MAISSALGSSALLPAGLGFRNVLINGDMRIAQRGTSTASITTGGYRTCDRWYADILSAGTWTQTQSTDAPAGFGNSLKMQCTTASASPVLAYIQYRLEGQDLQRFAKGTASAKPFAFSFWVKAFQAGIYICELYDADNNRQCSQSYTVNTSGTWEYKTITFPSDTTGAFDNDNAFSMSVNFWLAASSTFTSGTLNTSWAASVLANRAVGQTNVASSTSNYFQITGVQLEQNYQPTPFEQRPYGVELALCERYYQKCGVWHGTANNATNWLGTASARTSMRTTPSIGATGVLVVSNFYTADPQQSSLSISILSSGSDQLSICFWIFNLSGLTGGGYYGGGRSPGGVGTGNYLLLSAEL